MQARQALMVIFVKIVGNVHYIQTSCQDLWGLFYKVLASVCLCITSEPLLVIQRLVSLSLDFLVMKSMWTKLLYLSAE